MVCVRHRGRRPLRAVCIPRHQTWRFGFAGKVVEKIDPGFLTRTLGQLPLGVVLVSGTNGKTTTTRMVASMLSDLGLKVFTNPTGSNFVRGVVSALLTEVTLGGKLDADIAVLELDEAYAVHFVKQVKPPLCVAAERDARSA